MTISDERLGALLRGAKIDAQMSASARDKREAEEQVVILTELQQSRTTADTEQDGKGVKVRRLEWGRVGWVEALAAPEGLGVWYAINALDPNERTPPFTLKIFVGTHRKTSTSEMWTDGGTFGTVEEAKAAAEADYRQRILSTLSNAPQQEVFDDRDALISAVTEEQYRHGETGLELETMAAHNAVLIKALEAVAADVVGIGNGENAISDASRLLVESALTSPPPVDPAPSQDGVVTDAMRAALAVYGKWCVDIATLGELADLETRMSAVGISLQQMGEWTDLEAALNKGGE